MYAKRANAKKPFLLLLIIVMAIAAFMCQATGVFADAKSDALTQLQTQYETYDGKLVLVNGQSALESYFEEYKDRISSATDDGRVNTLLQSALSKMQLLGDIESEAEEIKTAYEAYYSGDYTELNYNKLTKFYTEAIADLQISALYESNNLNAEYAATKKQETLDAMANVSKITVVDLTDAKQAKIEKMQAMDEERKDSGFYSQTNIQTLDELLNEYIEKVNAAQTEAAIEQKYSEYVARVKSVLTVIQEVINDITYNETAENPVDCSEDAKNAINFYQSATDEEIKKENIDSYLSILKYYRKYFYEHNIIANVDLTHYSEANVQKINDCKKTARDAIYATALISEMENAKNQFDTDIANIPVNVNTVKTAEGSPYKITVISDNPYAFSPEAEVVAKDYRFKAYKTNTNTALKNSDNEDYRKVRVVYYINIKILQDGRYLDEFDGQTQYLVVISLDDVKDIVKYKDSLQVVYYLGNLKLDDNDYDAQIKEEDNVLMFTTNHFSPFAICAATAEGANWWQRLTSKLGFDEGSIFTNPFFYISIIFVLILFFVILFICLRNCKYKLSFNSMGGSKVKSVKARKCEYWETPENPKREGYVFGGWYSDKAYTSRFISLYCGRRKNIKVYAKWTKGTVGNDKVVQYFDALKAAMLTYEHDDKDNTISKKGGNVLIARMFMQDGKVALYFSKDVKKLIEKEHEAEYVKNENCKDAPVKFSVTNDVTFNEALAVIKDVMTYYGFVKGAYAPTAIKSSESERLNGFAFIVRKESEDTKLDRYAKEIRKYVNGYQVFDYNVVRFYDGRYLVKLVKEDDEIKLYLAVEPTANDQLVYVGDDKNYSQVPSMLVVKEEADKILALQLIDAVMTRSGMKYVGSSDKQITGDGSFAYKVQIDYAD